MCTTMAHLTAKSLLLRLLPIIVLTSFLITSSIHVIATTTTKTVDSTTASVAVENASFAAQCTVNVQIRSIACTARNNRAGDADKTAAAFDTIASPEFLHARRISLSGFNQPTLDSTTLSRILLLSAVTANNNNSAVNNALNLITLADVVSDAEEMMLSGNRIQRIRAGAFRQFPHLKTLDLSLNVLETIEAGAFDKLHSLAILDLSANQLDSFRPAANHTLAGLVMLNLRDNKLTTIRADDNWLCHMPALQHLSVARNQLSAMAVSNLTTTTTTTLCGNSTNSTLKSQLTHLDLHGNLLYALDNFTFRMMKPTAPLSSPLKLLFLDVSSTALSHVPSYLPETLRDLRLSNNNITRIDDDDLFACCPNLNLLVIEHSNLSTIGDNALIRLAHLERAWLSNNRLRAVPRVPVSLHGLFLDNNQIRQVNRIRCGGNNDNNSIINKQYESNNNNSLRVAQLQHLHLRNNHISRFEPCAFCDMPRLTILDLSENEIVALASRENKNVTLFAPETATHLELLNLSENFIGADSDRLAVGLGGVKTLAHVDFSFCTSLAQRRRQHASDEVSTVGLTETPEEEYSDTYDESNYISSKSSSKFGRSLDGSKYLLFNELIFNKKVERIDLGYCAPLANNLLNFIRHRKNGKTSFLQQSPQSRLLISLNGFNFAASTDDNSNRLGDLFGLLSLPADVDVSDTEWNCSDARLRGVVERLEKLDNNSRQFSSGPVSSDGGGALIQTSGSEPTCLYPASLNGLSLNDARVAAHMASEQQQQQKQLSNAVQIVAPQNSNANNNSNEISTSQQDTIDSFSDDDDAKDSRRPLKPREWLLSIAALEGDTSNNNNNIRASNNNSSSLSAEKQQQHPVTAANFTCDTWQALLAKQYYKIDSLLRHFQIAMRMHYNTAATDNSEQQQQHASVNRNEHSADAHDDQWWPMVKSTATDVHAVRQAAIFSALFVALLMLTCMCASLLIYCCYYRCLIWATSRRRRLSSSTTSRYSKSLSDNNNNGGQQQNGRGAVIQLTTQRSERVSSATSSSSVPSTASSSATSSSSTSSSVACKTQQRTGGGSDVVHYSRYHDQISTTPSTVFSIFDAASEREAQRQQPPLLPTNSSRQRNGGSNNTVTFNSGTSLYDYPANGSNAAAESVVFNNAARKSAVVRGGDDFTAPVVLQRSSAIGSRAARAAVDEEEEDVYVNSNTTRRPSRLVYEQF